MIFSEFLLHLTLTNYPWVLKYVLFQAIIMSFYCAMLFTVYVLDSFLCQNKNLSVIGRYWTVQRLLPRNMNKKQKTMSIVQIIMNGVNGCKKMSRFSTSLFACYLNNNNLFLHLILENITYIC